MIKGNIILTFKNGNILQYANKFLVEKTGNDGYTKDNKDMSTPLVSGIPGVCYYYTGLGNDEYKDQTGLGKILGDYNYFVEQIGKSGKLKFPEANKNHGDIEEIERDSQYIGINSQLTKSRYTGLASELVSVSVQEEWVSFPDSNNRESGYTFPKSSDNFRGFQESKEPPVGLNEERPNFDEHITYDNGFIPNPILSLDNNNVLIIENEKEYTEVFSKRTKNGYECYGVSEKRDINDNIIGKKTSGTSFIAFHPIYITITREINNASMKPIEPIKVEKGKKINYGTLNDTDDYKFKEWTLDAEGNNKDLPETSEEDFTIYAQWTENVKPVTHKFIRNFNYEGAPNPITIELEEGVELDYGTNPTRENYTFNKWTIDSAGTSSEAVPKTMGNKDITVYAQWIENEKPTVKHNFTKNFNYEGSTPETVEVEEGAKLNYGENPTRENYTFDKWTVDQAGTSSEQVPTVMGTENIIVYAQWIENEKPTVKHNFTKNFNYEGSVSETVEVEEGKPLDYGTNPERENYTFDKWTNDAEGTSSEAVPTTMGTEDITVYAQWIESSSGINCTYAELDDEISKLEAGKEYDITIDASSAPVADMQGTVGYPKVPSALANKIDAAPEGTLLNITLKVPAELSNLKGTFLDSSKEPTSKVKSIKIILNGAEITKANSTFYGCANLVSADMSNLTSLSLMANMFDGCTNLQAIDISNVNQTPESTELMFNGCKSLSEVTWGSIRPKKLDNMFNNANNGNPIKFIVNTEEDKQYIINNKTNMKLTNTTFEIKN